MKLQSQVLSKDLSTLKELAELDKFKEIKDAEATNAKNQETEEKQFAVDTEEDETKIDAMEKINATKCVTTSEKCFLKWDNCCLKPDNCCVVKAVRKLAN